LSNCGNAEFTGNGANGGDGIGDRFGESSERVRREFGEKFGEKFGENHVKEKIIEIMRENPTVSAKTIAAIIKISPRGVEKNIRELKTVGLVDRAGPPKGGRWVVKS